jgi:hypothetical protein
MGVPVTSLHTKMAGLLRGMLGALDP